MTAESSLELPESFGVAISFAGTETTLALRGEVDILTAPEFGVILGGLIDRSHRNIVLDCTELGFMDASGLGVIAAAANRLSVSGMKLRDRFAVRTPPPVARDHRACNGHPRRARAAASRPPRAGTVGSSDARRC